MINIYGDKISCLILGYSSKDRHRDRRLTHPANVLDRGHGYSNRYNSAEGVLFTHE